MDNEVPEKRICESLHDPEVELEPFEECPTCHSKSYHLLLKFIDEKWTS